MSTVTKKAYTKKQNSAVNAGETAGSAAGVGGAIASGQVKRAGVHRHIRNSRKKESFSKSIWGVDHGISKALVQPMKAKPSIATSGGTLTKKPKMPVVPPVPKVPTLK